MLTLVLAQIADPAVDLGGAISAFALAVQQGKYGEAVSLGLMLVIFGLRVLSKKLPESGISKALTSTWGGWVLNFAVSIAGAIGTALAMGQPITVVLIVSALTNALAASGTWELLKDVLAAPKLAAANAAGTTVATGIGTKPEAVAELDKP